MEAMTATLAAQRLRQKEESAGRGRMRHAHLVNIELAGMALFHVSLFFAAVMTGFGLFTLYSLDVADPSGVAIQLSQRFGIEVSALILLLVSIAGLALPTSFFIFLAWALRKLVAVPYAAQLAAPKKRFPNDP